MEKIPSLSIWGLIGLQLNSFNSSMCLCSLVLEGLEQRDSSRLCLSLYADKDHSVSHWTILCYHPVVAFASQNSLTFFFFFFDNQDSCVSVLYLDSAWVRDFTFPGDKI